MCRAVRTDRVARYRGGQQSQQGERHGQHGPPVRADPLLSSGAQSTFGQVSGHRVTLGVM
jgi:hypothetical protein